MAETKLYSLQCTDCLMVDGFMYMKKPEHLPCEWCEGEMQPYIMGNGLKTQKDSTE